MSKPIVTLGCNHICPMKDGKKEHVGGPVIKGSPNVFAGGKPVARVGDQLQCQSPSLDIIMKGSSSVFANGQPIAGMGDKTAHGGTILGGTATILIG